MKRFSQQRDAEKWARAFDKARAFSNLKPLRVERDDEEWIVINPGNVVRTPVPK